MARDFSWLWALGLVGCISQGKFDDLKQYEAAQGQHELERMVRTK